MKYITAAVLVKTFIAVADAVNLFGLKFVSVRPVRDGKSSDEGEERQNNSCLFFVFQGTTWHTYITSTHGEERGLHTCVLVCERTRTSLHTEQIAISPSLMKIMMTTMRCVCTAPFTPPHAFMVEPRLETGFCGVALKCFEQGIFLVQSKVS